MFIYYINANIEDEDLSSLSVFKNFNFLEELRISSKTFNSYKECVDVSISLINDIINELKESDRKFTFFSDSNPNFVDKEQKEFTSVPGVGMLEKWGQNELSRFYVIDESQLDESKIFYTKLIISIFSVDKTKPI